eukprot:jgi/Hompol1/2712/HPOL_005800-RA
MSTVNISDFQNAARQVMTDAKNAVDSMEQTHSSMTAPTRNRFSLAPALTTPLFWSRPQHQPSKLASIQFLASASQHRQPQTTTSLATQPENTHGQHQQEDTSSESDELHRHRRAQRDKPDQSAQILRTHGLRFIKENLRTPVSDPSNKVEQQEVVLTISFALRKGDIRGSNMIVKILGSQTLEDLADAVPCLCDFLTVGDDVPTNRTAFFLMDNVFYGRGIDGDTPNAMPYIQAIDKFMKSNHTQFGTKPTSVQNMTCRLADLILEQGRRYLYMHQGDCSHVFVVQNVRWSLLAFVPIAEPEACILFSQIALNFVKECFNDLAISMKRDFDRERTFIKEQDHMRYIWMCQFALRFRRTSAEMGHLIEIEAILGVLNTPNLVYAIRRLNSSRDEKNIPEMTLCLQLLDQLLHTVDELSRSDQDDLAEVASQLISALYYEHDNAVLLRGLCKDVKVHSKSYLEALVLCIDTLLRTTERMHSQQGMIITRRRARKSKKTASSVEQQASANDPNSDISALAAVIDNGSDEEDNTGADQPRYTENVFNMESYMRGFASESTIANYCLLLRHYPDVSPGITDAILRMFRRLFEDLDCKEPFYKPGAINGEFVAFVKSVIGSLVAKIGTDDQSKGAVEILKILFTGIRPDTELARSNDEDLVELVGNTDSLVLDNNV